MKIIAVEFNDVDGGSVSVTVARDSLRRPEFQKLQEMLMGEEWDCLDALGPCREFADQAVATKGV